jgi:hypothetical protein
MHLEVKVDEMSSSCLLEEQLEMMKNGLACLMHLASCPAKIVQQS